MTRAFSSSIDASKLPKSIVNPLAILCLFHRFVPRIVNGEQPLRFVGRHVPVIFGRAVEDLAEAIHAREVGYFGGNWLEDDLAEIRLL